MAITQLIYEQNGERALIPTVAQERQQVSAGLVPNARLSFIPGIDLTKLLPLGTWKLTFSYLLSFLVPRIDAPKTFDYQGWRFTLKEYTIDDTLRKVYVKLAIEGQVTTQGLVRTEIAPAVPVAVIAYAAIFILGLGAIALTLEKVEAVLEHPAANVALIVGALVVLVILWRMVRGKK